MSKQLPSGRVAHIIRSLSVLHTHTRFDLQIDSGTIALFACLQFMN